MMHVVLMLSFLGLPLCVTCHPHLNPHVQLPSLRDTQRSWSYEALHPDHHSEASPPALHPAPLLRLPPVDSACLTPSHPLFLLGLPHQIRTPQTIFIFQLPSSYLHY